MKTQKKEYEIDCDDAIQLMQIMLVDICNDIDEITRLFEAVTGIEDVCYNPKGDSLVIKVDDINNFFTKDEMKIGNVKEVNNG